MKTVFQVKAIPLLLRAGERPDEGVFAEALKCFAVDTAAFSESESSYTNQCTPSTVGVRGACTACLANERLAERGKRNVPFAVKHVVGAEGNDVSTGEHMVRAALHQA